MHIVDDNLLMAFLSCFNYGFVIQVISENHSVAKVLLAM